MKPFLQRLSKIANCYVHAYPNAGLPNAMGGYDETPEMFGEVIKEFAEEGIVNMVGGCCGTNPAYIKEVSRVVKGALPRQVPEKEHLTLLSGLTEFKLTPNIRFVNVGERCNIAGSALFKKMIEKKDYEAALKVAKDQV